MAAKRPQASELDGRGFYSEKDNVDFLNHLQAFLAKYIGPDVRPTG